MRRREQDWAEQKARWAQHEARDAEFAKRAAEYAKEAAERKKELDKMTKETTRKFDQFYGTEINRCKQIEEEVEEALQSYCTKINNAEEDSREDYVVVLDKGCHKLIDETKQTVVEWDGLVIMTSSVDNTLFLIEAKLLRSKSYAKPPDVEDINNRVQKTKDYIHVMADGLKHSAIAKCRHQANNLAPLKDYKIKVAIGGPSITETMKDTIIAHGYYLVRVENLKYTVTPP